MTVTIDSITVVDPPEAWRANGFDVEGDTCRVGTIDVRLVGEAEGGRGLRSWTLRGARTDALDGLATEIVEEAEAGPAAGPHPNGTRRIDHVVAFTPDRMRTADALQRAGLDLRRLRDEPTPAGGGFQAFFRLGEAILEVIEIAEARRTRLWGLAFLVDDLDATADHLGDRLSEPREAVQPGRRIATLKDEAGLSFGCAFMSPGPGAA